MSDTTRRPIHALVLGGYGATGAGVVERLRRRGDRATVVGRDPRRADLVADLRAGPDVRLRDAMRAADVVVNASGVEDLRLLDAAAVARVPFVDVTATTAYVDAIEAWAPRSPVLLSVGLAPGLTTVLAAAVHASFPGPLDVGIVLGAGERHGRAGTRWARDLLGRRFPDTAAGAPVRNYTRGRVFDVPGLGRRRLYRADFSDQHTLTRALGVPVRTYFALDSRPATAALALLTRVPGARRIPARVPLPGSDRWIVFAAGRASRACAAGRSQAAATAAVTALAARAAVGLAPGVHHLDQVCPLASLADDPAIRVVGPQPVPPDP